MTLGYGKCLKASLSAVTLAATVTITLRPVAHLLALHCGRSDPGLKLVLGAGAIPDDTPPAVGQTLVDLRDEADLSDTPNSRAISVGGGEDGPDPDRPTEQRNFNGSFSV